MKKTKLLWLISKYPNALNPMDGGPYKNIAEIIVRKGIAITVVAPVPFVPPFLCYFSNKLKIYKDTPHYEVKTGIKIIRPKYFVYPKHLHYGMPHKFMFYAIRHIFAQKPDLIHAHYAYPFGMLALELSKYWNIPYLLTLRGCDVNLYPYYNNQSDYRFKKAVLGAVKVFAISNSLADRTKELTGRKPKVISIGVNLSSYENLPDKPALREKLELPHDKFIVLYAGHFIKAKGIVELLQAIKTIQKDVLGIFIGYGPLENLIKSSKGVISKGLQPHSLIPLFMKAADVLVLPSYREGLGNVLVEAGAAGLPVIGSDVGGISELLADGRGILIKPGSAEAIVEAINKVRSDYQSALQRAGKLKKYVEKHYNVNKNAEIIINEYKNLIQND